MGATMYGTPASNDDGQGQGRNDCHHDHIEKGQQHFDQWLNENVNVEGDVDGHDIVDLENQVSCYSAFCPDALLHSPIV